MYPPNLFPTKMSRGPSAAQDGMMRRSNGPSTHGQAVPNAQPAPPVQVNGYPEQSVEGTAPSGAQWNSAGQKTLFSPVNVGFVPSALPPAPPVQYPSTGSLAPPSLTTGQRPALPKTGLHPPVPRASGSHDMHGSSQSAVQASARLIPDMSNLNINTRGSVDLLKQRHIMPSRPIEGPTAFLPPPFDCTDVYVQPDVIRCTLTTLPSSKGTLKNCRLPLGLILHPYKDLKKLTIVSTRTIVRCRSCRVYINPYVLFPDHQHWRCNLCGRNNALPDDFHFDPTTQTFGDPTRRPEVKNASVEFVAPQEYMSRAPPPACYLFILDVSKSAVKSGYIGVLCEKIAEHLSNMPGDKDTLISFMAVNSCLHFFTLKRASRPKHLIFTEVDDMTLPCHADVIHNLNSMEMEIRNLLMKLPDLFSDSDDPNCALGSALKLAHQLIGHSGGRVSVFMASLPNIGKGILENREDPNLRASTEVQHMTPATDFYKQLALECSSSQIGVDLFVLSDKYVDVATIGDIVKFTGGCVMHYPDFSVCNNPTERERFMGDLNRYLLRKIGFEAVLRVRCTSGYAVHSFFGNHFVRSTDLVVLPNVSPDSALGVLLDVEENIESRVACFQAALLYTTSHGERRIRVHTVCLPTSESIAEVHHGADAQAIVAFLARMATDRCSTGGSLQAAREALVNAVVDALHSYGSCLSSKQFGTMLCSWNLRVLPVYVLALLKSNAFCQGTSIKLDHRMASMCNFRTSPLLYLILNIYPNLYALHDLTDAGQVVPLLSLSFEMIDRNGVYLMDTGIMLYLYVARDVSARVVSEIFGVSTYQEIATGVGSLPELQNPRSTAVRKFIEQLDDERPFSLPLRIIKEDSASRELFTARMVEDRTESSLSYTEFLHHLQNELRPT